MADCPKCGFTQPDDQYCANCGVDMKGYKPDPDPFFKRIMQNLGAQIALVLIIVAGLFSGIYVTQREVIDKKLRKALKTNSSDELLAEAQPVKEEVALNQPATSGALALNANSPSIAPAEPEPTISTEPISRLEVSFAEVPMPLIQIWADEGQVLSEDSQTRSLLVTQAGALSGLRRQDWEPLFLPGGSTRTVNTTDPLIEQYLEQVPSFDEEVGLALEFSTRSLSPEKINFDIQVVVSLPAELDSSVITTSISGSYEIPKGGVLVIIGLVPQSSARGESADALNGTPLAVMQSPEFLAGASEFALIIRPE